MWSRETEEEDGGKSKGAGREVGKVEPRQGYNNQPTEVTGTADWLT